MNSFEELPQYELESELWEGGFDMNIQDVGIMIRDVNTLKVYKAEEAYFEHGIDEYFIDENELEQIYEF